MLGLMHDGFQAESKGNVRLVHGEEGGHKILIPGTIYSIASKPKNLGGCHDLVPYREPCLKFIDSGIVRDGT